MTAKQDLSQVDKFVGSKRWRRMTADKKSKLIELYNQGLKKKEIAKELDLTCRNVYVWIKKLGLPQRQRKRRKPLTEHEKSKLIELYNQGLTNKKIAKELDVARRTVYVWIKKLELPPRERYKGRSLKKMHTLNPMVCFPSLFLKEVTELHKQGLNDLEIAKEMEVSPQTIGVIRARLNLPVNRRKRVNS